MNQAEMFSHSDAIISPCGNYRYLLTRTISQAPGVVCFIMLNPSTADANLDDPTIRRCMGYARDWGYGQLLVVNLFGLRATNPQELYLVNDPVGPGNDDAITNALDRADEVICAWGNHGGLHYQDAHVLSWMDIAGIQPKCLKISKRGMPCHPLYLNKGLKLIDYCLEDIK